MNAAKQKHNASLVNFSRFFKWCSLIDFHRYKMSMGLYNGERTRSSTLRLPWLTYGRRGIRAQKNSEQRSCGVFKSDRSHCIKRNHTLSKHALLKLWIPQRYIGGLIENASKSTSLKVSHLYVYLRIRIRSVLHKILSIPFITFCNLISLWICRLPK